MNDTERIEALERKVQALQTLLTDLVEKYNWHDHQYDYSQNNNYDFDAVTQPPTSKDRADSTGLQNS